MRGGGGTGRRAAALAGACAVINFVYALFAGYHDGHLVTWITIVRSVAGYGLGLLLAVALFAVRPLYKQLRVPFNVLALGLSLIVVTLLAIVDLWEQVVPKVGAS